MSIENYLLRNVKPSEFRELKAKEAEIISEVIDGFNDVWKPRVENIKATFKYNPRRNMIGIHIEINGYPCMVKNKEGLNDEEHTLVRTLYTNLIERLESLQLKEDEWVDSI